MYCTKKPGEWVWYRVNLRKVFCKRKPGEWVCYRVKMKKMQFTREPGEWVWYKPKIKIEFNAVKLSEGSFVVAQYLVALYSGILRYPVVDWVCRLAYFLMNAMTRANLTLSYVINFLFEYIFPSSIYFTNILKVFFLYNRIKN